MNETEHLLMKALERHKSQLEEAAATGWYKGEPTIDNEVARIDSTLAGMRSKAIHVGKTDDATATQLLEAAKLAYRKHHLGDDRVGWDELSEALQDALCEAMGDEAFVEWLQMETKR